MNDIPRIGPKRVPDDAEIHKFLNDLILESKKILFERMGELSDTINETSESGQPPEFAYAKLLNYLQAQLSPNTIYLCAAAMWELQKKTETDGT